jgi:hypothetical protein
MNTAHDRLVLVVRYRPYINLTDISVWNVCTGHQSENMLQITIRFAAMLLMNTMYSVSTDLKGEMLKLC